MFVFVILIITMFVVLVLWRPCAKLQEAVCEEDTEKTWENGENPENTERSAPHRPGNFRRTQVARAEGAEPTLAWQLSARESCQARPGKRCMGAAGHWKCGQSHTFA